MKLVILERDGVINFDSEKSIRSPDEWKPIPGSLEAIARLNQNGYRVVVASNQSGIGRGLHDVAALNAIHAKMHKALAQFGGHIDAIFFCPHAEESGCDCRKPKTGLFRQIAERFHADLQGVPAVGDSLRDLDAAALVGAKPVLVETGKGKQTIAAGGLPQETEIFSNLAAVADAIIGQA